MQEAIHTKNLTSTVLVDPRFNWQGGIEAATLNGIAILQVQLTEGYYDVECNETGQSFGIIAALPFEEWGVPHDTRFAVLAGFSQICNTAQVSEREPLLSLLAKIGIGRYRDFPEMGLIRANATAP